MATATIVTSTSGMTREDWLESRKVGIGGSDAAKVLGLSRWGGPLSVYMEKMGLAADIEAGEAAYWGNQMEDIVAKEFAKREGLRVRRQNKIFRHPDHPWMIANIDRAIIGQNKGLECKTASAYFLQEWEGDNLPDAYYCQIQHYIEVMGWDSCWVAALVGGNKFIHKEVARNRDFIAAMVEAERTFWCECIEKETPPEFSPWDDPKVLFPHQGTDDLIPPTPDVIEIADELMVVNEEIKTLTARKEDLEGKLKSVVKEAQGIEGICTWKEQRGVPKWKDLALAKGVTEQEMEASRGSHRRFSLTYKGR